MRKRIAFAVTVALVTILAACGSSGGTQQSSGTAAQTEDLKEEPETSEEVTELKESTPASEDAASEDAVTEEVATEPAGTVAEYLEPADAGSPGHFSDPKAFKGFDSYKAQYSDHFKDSFPGTEVTLGKTVLKDHYTGEILDTKQYADETHAAAKDPEKLEAGAVGLAGTSVASLLGNPVYYVVYNPSDAAAAFEDCLIIGFEETNASSLVFSNGSSFVMAGGSSGQSGTDPREEIIAALGEPYETEGEINESSNWASYYWRDESGKHILKVDIWGSDGHFQTESITYKNFESQEAGTQEAETQEANDTIKTVNIGVIAWSTGKAVEAEFVNAVKTTLSEQYSEQIGDILVMDAHESTAMLFEYIHNLYARWYGENIVILIVNDENGFSDEDLLNLFEDVEGAQEGVNLTINVGIDHAIDGAPEIAFVYDASDAVGCASMIMENAALK